MSESHELNASELGTLDYWDKIYDREIHNFKDHGDVGEVWFGKHNAQKVVRCISEQLDLSTADKIIDIGCGNGWTLVELAERGFTDLTGVDYSQKAVDLATEVLRNSKIDTTNVKLMTCDILDIEKSPVGIDFKLAHDKGTYDAISLSPEDPQGQRAKYIKNVCSILSPEGYLVISSCNWTKDELIEHFKNDFEVIRTLHTPAFSFGGKVGESLSGVVFRKKKITTSKSIRDVPSCGRSHLGCPSPLAISAQVSAFGELRSPVSLLYRDTDSAREAGYPAILGQLIIKFVDMKLNEFFIAFVAVSSCSWHFRIHATSTDQDTGQPKFHVNYNNLVWNCESNADCTASGSLCVNKECRCEQNFVFNAAMTSCLKAADRYGDICVETVQCTVRLQAGGNCSDGICSCATGYHYLHGRCNKSFGLNEKCRNDDDCYVNFDYEGLSCTKDVCRCTDGFYQREYRACRREAKEIGAECMIDLDCTFDENARCDKTNGCFVESKSNETDASRSPKDAAPRTLGLEGFDSAAPVAGSCTTDKECEDLGAATCDAAVGCICRPGYFIGGKKTKCIPELGEKCAPADAVGEIKNSICRNGQWNCKGATMPARNNRKCLKVTRAYNSSCTQDEQCYIFGPDASCVVKRCLCNEESHYNEEKMFCWVNKGVGESCNQSLDCYVKGFDSGLTCSDKFICECPTGFHINAAGTVCIKDVAVLGDSCTEDEDCKPLKNAECQKNICSCVENYFDWLGECVSGYDAPCKDDVDCKADNSTCLSERCGCVEGFVSPSAGLCIHASSFGGACHYDAQCSATTANALCSSPEFPEVDKSTIGQTLSANGTCSCNSGHHYRHGRCYRTKLLHEPCNSRGECYVESDPDNVVCLKGLCSCAWKAAQVNATFCKSGASSKMVFSIPIGLTMLILTLIGDYMTNSKIIM